MGFLVFVKKGAFFLPGVMWAKLWKRTWQVQFRFRDITCTMENHMEKNMAHEKATGMIEELPGITAISMVLGSFQGCSSYRVIQTDLNVILVII